MSYVEFVFNCETGKCSQKTRQSDLKFVRNKHSIFELVTVTFTVMERTLIRTDLDNMLGNHFMPHQQNNAIICNFCQDPSKHFHVPETC